MAGGAGSGAGARFGARAVAAVARLHARHLNFGAHAEDRVVELDLQVVADIFAALRAAAAAPAAGSAEQVAEAEQIAQNVAEIARTLRG